MDGGMHQTQKVNKNIVKPRTQTRIQSINNEISQTNLTPYFEFPFYLFNYHPIQIQYKIQAQFAHPLCPPLFSPLPLLRGKGSPE